MKEKIALISILANVILTAGKIFVGLISDSSAVLAEGIHSLMDILSSAIGYAGIKLAKKPEDERHPYGHYKFEVLAGLAITLILFTTGAGVIYESYQKILNPSELNLPFLALGIMTFSAVVNAAMSKLKIKFGKKEGSVALISDGVHSQIDVYSSLAIFAGIFLARYWPWADPVFAFLVGIYILSESFSLGKEATDSLLDVSAGKEIEEKIRLIAKNENIKLESLKTQKKGSVITANLEISLPKDLNVEEATIISENLRKELTDKITNLSYVAIQIKSYDMEVGFYKPKWGKGFGWQRKGRFVGKIKEAEGKGIGGFCVCPKCGYRISHQQGIPCSTIACPKCGTKMERK